MIEVECLSDFELKNGINISHPHRQAAGCLLREFGGSPLCCNRTNLINIWLTLPSCLICIYIYIEREWERDGLVSYCSISSVLSMEILQSFTKSSICKFINHIKLFLYLTHSCIFLHNTTTIDSLQYVFKDRLSCFTMPYNVPTQTGASDPCIVS